ncbi:MAG: aldo/keto reductase [bacterium]
MRKVVTDERTDFTGRVALGRTGISVSRLGLAGGYGVGAEAVERAYYEFGINYFYWSTPRRGRFGDGLRRLIKSHRDEIVIVLQSYGHVGRLAERAVHKGLKSLGIDYCDALLLGWHNRMPSRGVIDSVTDLKRRGLVRAIAMSGHNRKFFGQLAGQPDSPIDIFMIRYNAAHRGAETEIFPLLPESNRPGVTIYTATSWGKLLKKRKMPPGQRPLTAAECYRFVLSNPHVDLCMMGPRNEQEMRQGLTALSQGPVGDEEVRRFVEIGDHVHG